MSQASPASSQPTPTRSRRKTEIGIVTSDKMNKTRRVVVERLVPHPKYGKLLRRRTICHAHDEANASHKGDWSRSWRPVPCPSSSGGGSSGSSGPAPSRPWPARTRPPRPRLDVHETSMNEARLARAEPGRHVTR